MCNAICKKSWPQDNSRSSCSLTTSKINDTCPTGHASTSGDPHTHPCTTLHLLMLSLCMNTLSIPVTSVITATADRSQSADTPTASAKPQAAGKPVGAPSHTPGATCHPATTHAWPQKLRPATGNGSACSREHATNPGNSQKVPRAHQAPHQPCPPCRSGCPPSWPSAKPPPYTAGPMQHTASPATVKHAGAPFHAPGHHAQPLERPQLPHSLPLKGEGAACPIGNASASGDW